MPKRPVAILRNPVRPAQATGWRKACFTLVMVTALCQVVSPAFSGFASPMGPDPSPNYPTANLRNAVIAARVGSPCGPLRYNAIAERAAEISGRSSDDWINHYASRIPVTDPLPGLEDLGYRGKKGILLSGAGKNEADAIHGAILEGFDKLPDCSYTDFGVNELRNNRDQYFLTSIILAGPQGGY